MLCLIVSNFVIVFILMLDRVRPRYVGPANVWECLSDSDAEVEEEEYEEHTSGGLWSEEVLLRLVPQEEVEPEEDRYLELERKRGREEEEEEEEERKRGREEEQEQEEGEEDSQNKSDRE